VISGAKAAVSFAGNCGFLSRLTCIAGKKKSATSGLFKTTDFQKQAFKAAALQKRTPQSNSPAAVIHVGVCKFHQTGILNRGSGGQGQLDVGFI